MFTMYNKIVLRITILTLFPEALIPYTNSSILGRAQKKRLVSISFLNFRKYASNKHKTVDEKAYGGGPGMVLKVEPIFKAVMAVKRKRPSEKTRVILFSTRGKIFNQKEARRLSKYKNLIFICGHYEGVDERVAAHVADEELSIGSYVLSGGELPALIATEAVSRHVPGVLGKLESLEEHKGSYPVYTRPESFAPVEKKRSKKAWRVPSELLSGNHERIKMWRAKHGRLQK